MCQQRTQDHSGGHALLCLGQMGGKAQREREDKEIKVEINLEAESSPGILVAERSNKG